MEKTLTRARAYKFYIKFKSVTDDTTGQHPKDPNWMISQLRTSNEAYNELIGIYRAANVRYREKRAELVPEYAAKSAEYEKIQTELEALQEEVDKQKRSTRKNVLVPVETSQRQDFLFAESKRVAKELKTIQQTLVAPNPQMIDFALENDAWVKSRVKEIRARYSGRLIARTFDDVSARAAQAKSTCDFDPNFRRFDATGGVFFQFQADALVPESASRDREARARRVAYRELSVEYRKGTITKEQFDARVREEGLLSAAEYDEFKSTLVRKGVTRVAELFDPHTRKPIWLGLPEKSTTRRRKPVPGWVRIDGVKREFTLKPVDLKPHEREMYADRLDPRLDNAAELKGVRIKRERLGIQSSYFLVINVNETYTPRYVKPKMGRVVLFPERRYVEVDGVGRTEVATIFDGQKVQPVYLPIERRDLEACNHHEAKTIYVDALSTRCYTEDLQQTETVHLNNAVSALILGCQQNEAILPDWLKEARNGMRASQDSLERHPKYHARKFVSLVKGFWANNRFEGDESMYKDMRKAVRKLRHYHDWICAERFNSINRRESFYEAFARQLAERAPTDIVIVDTKLKQQAQKKKKGFNTDNENDTRRKLDRHVALSYLVGKVQAAAGRVGIPVIKAPKVSKTQLQVSDTTSDVYREKLHRYLYAADLRAPLEDQKAAE